MAIKFVIKCEYNKLDKNKLLTYTGDDILFEYYLHKYNKGLTIK